MSKQLPKPIPTKYILEFLSQEFHKHVAEKKSSTDFNLPLALKTIVDEIIDLKKASESSQKKNDS